MSRLVKLSFVALVAGVFAVSACKKKDDKKPKKKPIGGKVQPKPDPKTKPDPKPDPKAKAVTGQALVTAIENCWKAFDSKNEKEFEACYDENAKFELMDQVAMGPGKHNADNRADMMKITKQYWSMLASVKSHLDLVLVSGDAAIVISRSDNSNTPALGGKSVKMYGAQLINFNAAGKVTSDRHMYDQTSMSVQMGWTPAKTPHRAAWEKPLWESPVRVVAKNDDKEKNNLAAHKKWIEDVNSGDAKKAMAHLADKAVMRHMDMPKDATGKKEIGDMMAMFRTAFPKFKLTVKEAWAAGDWTFAYTTFEGKNTGAMKGMADKPTNKDVTLHTLSVTRWDNNKVAEHVVFSNSFSAFNQMFPEKVAKLKEKMKVMMEQMMKMLKKPAGTGAPPKGTPPKGKAPDKKKMTPKKAPPPKKKNVPPPG